VSVKGHDGLPVVPMTLACLVSAVILGWMGTTVISSGDGEATLVERLIVNPMCRLILGVAIAACLFALLELRGALMDARGRRGALAWACGRTEEALAADHWIARQEQRLSPLTYAIFALPLLGFIGTVIGISGAIGDLGTMFEAADRSEALARVLGELRFAFDTTFAGLAGVLPVALLLLVIRNVNATVGAKMAVTP